VWIANPFLVLAGDWGYTIMEKHYDLFKKMEGDVIQLMLCDYLNLYDQYNESETLETKFTGVGFYSRFHNLSSTSDSKHDMQTFHANGILNDNILVGFVLFVKNGFLDFLEGFTYDERWPENIQSYKVFLKDGGEKR